MRLLPPLLLAPLLAQAVPAPAEQLAFGQVPHERISTAPASAGEPLLSADFAAWASGLLEVWGVPGAAVGVVKIDPETDEVRTEFVNVGTAGRERAMSEDILFGIASNSKAFTAAAVAQLVDQGRVSWTSRATEVIPGLGFADEFAHRQAMLKDVLSHRTGLPRHDHSYQTGTSFADFVARIEHLRPSAELREEWQYNNQMFISAAFLASNLTATAYTDLVADSIFRPLNMSASTFTPHLDDPSLAKLSSSFVTLDNNTVIEIPYGFNHSFAALQLNAGAGGVVTSARDGLKWVEFLIRQRQAATAKPAPPRTRLDEVLSRESVLEMSRGQMLAQRVGPYPESSQQLYGLGLELVHYQGVQTVRHGGSIPGFGTQVLWSSEKGVGVVAFCNAADSGNALSDILSYRAFDQAAGMPAEVDWNARYLAKRDAARNATRAAVQSASVGPRSPAPVAADLIGLLGTYHDPAYGTVTVCPAAKDCLLSAAADAALPPACEQLYERLSGALAGGELQPLHPSHSALYIDAPGFFGDDQIALRWAGEGEDEGQVWRGQYQYLMGTLVEDGREEGPKVLAGAGEVDSVRVKFGGGGMEWSGVWGSGPGVEAKEDVVEVRFEKVQ